MNSQDLYDRILQHVPELDDGFVDSDPRMAWADRTSILLHWGPVVLMMELVEEQRGLRIVGE